MQAFYTGYEETVNRFTFKLAFFDYIANSGEYLILYRYRFVGTIQLHLAGLYQWVFLLIFERPPPSTLQEKLVIRAIIGH